VYKYFTQKKRCFTKNSRLFCVFLLSWYKGNTAQFPPNGLSTAPADLRAKSRRKRRLRSEAPRCGSVCGTASALPKCSIIHKVLSALLA